MLHRSISNYVSLSTVQHWPQCLTLSFPIEAVSPAALCSLNTAQSPLPATDDQGPSAIYGESNTIEHGEANADPPLTTKM
jgi:hypothetical protein